MAKTKPLMAKSSGTDGNAAVQSARRTFEAEGSGISALTAALQGPLGTAFAAAVDLIIQASRLQGGPRKVTSISEIVGMEGDTIIMQEIFAFRQQGVDQNGRAFGEFMATGIRPTFMDRLETAGYHLPGDLFRQRSLLRD